MRSRLVDCRSRPLAEIAWPAAATANCETRSIFAASASVKSGAGCQSTSAPTCAPDPWVIASGRRRMPERPSARERRKSSTEFPSGETTPAPVIATRRAAIACRSGLARGGQGRGDVALEVGERLDAFQVLVGDADTEFFLDLEHELDEAERVDADRVERRGGIQPFRVDRELLGRLVCEGGELIHGG